MVRGTWCVHGSASPDRIGSSSDWWINQPITSFVEFEDCGSSFLYPRPTRSEIGINEENISFVQIVARWFDETVNKKTRRRRRRKNEQSEKRRKLGGKGDPPIIGFIGAAPLSPRIPRAHAARALNLELKPPRVQRSAERLEFQHRQKCVGLSRNIVAGERERERDR